MTVKRNRASGRSDLISCLTVGLVILSVACFDRSALNSAAEQRDHIPSVKTDARIYAEPNLPQLPKAGGSYSDPVFGSPILRLTDESDGKNCTVSYSYWPSFNRDNTRLIALCDSKAVLFRFDPLNFRLLGKEPLFADSSSVALFDEDLIWSGASENLLYGHAGLKLWAYDVRAKEFKLVRDFNAELRSGLLWQMSKSADDNVFAFTKRDAAYRNVGYMVWRRDQNRIVKNETLANLDEVQLDKSGRFLLVKANIEAGRDAQIVWLESDKTQSLTDKEPDYSPGHSDNGAGVIIGYDNDGNRVLKRSFDRPREFISLLSLENDWSQAMHISMLAEDETWALISTYSTSTAGNGAFHDEILQVKTDGSGAIRRLAHHRSRYGEYYDSPRANISRDGKFIAYTSNWEGSGRRDVFILKVPPPLPVAANDGATPATTTMTAVSTWGSPIAQAVVWTNLVNCTTGGSGLRKSSGRDGLLDAAARSQQMIASGDGYVEFVATGANTTRLCGLTRQWNQTDFAALDFAIRLTGTGTAEVRENGFYANEIGYRSGDRFRITVEAERVTYWKNGAAFYISLKTPAYPLAAAAAFASNGATLSQVTIAALAGGKLTSGNL